MLIPKMSPRVPNDHIPHVTQQAFLLLDDKEAFYGGAAGGGKSDALLMAALQYDDFPQYRALILRRTYPELSMAGAIMDRAKDWLANTDAVWSADEHKFTFPSGATLTFAHAQYEDDVRRFGGTNFHFIAFDELTRFSEFQYRFLFSRLRKNEGDPIPLRMRGASNPGDLGHEWVKARFVQPGHKARPFIPAKLLDNPSLDREQYIQSLMELHPTERRRLLEGDWDVAEPGAFFRREWFEIVDAAPKTLRRMVRYWDLAATPPDGKNDPDWTAGFKMGVDRAGRYWGLNMQRIRAHSYEVEALVKQTAILDGKSVPIFIEREPGSAGKALVNHYKRLLPGWTVTGIPSSKKKSERAAPVASQANGGNIVLVNGAWVGPFLDEADVFGTETAHDDQIDAMSGAFAQLAIAGAKTLIRY